MFKEVEVIVFDADDTLWVNETYFRDAEKKFEKTLSIYGTESEIHEKLYQKEIENLKPYGYGIKGFVLSMIECALEISDYKVANSVINEILTIGKEMLYKPVEVIGGVEEVLKKLHKRYRLVVATKGDLLDQERKFFRSGLDNYFDKIIVMSDKKEADFKRVFKELEVAPNNILMIGNSLKSDVLPVVKLGAKAIHIPFHTTWVHEEVKEEEINEFNYKTLSDIKELLAFL